MTSRELEDALLLVKQAIAGKSAEDLDKLRRSIRWHALGEMELENKIDKFIKFWISLEVLVSKQQGNDVMKVKNALKALFPENAVNIDQNGVVSRLYGLRKEIFHQGRLSSQELLDPTQDLNLQLHQLKGILLDLLRAELNLPRLDLSKKYFL